MALLAGDIGGTKTLLKWVETDLRGDFVDRLEQRYVSAEWDSLTSMCLDFIERAKPHGYGHPTAACFGIAGPVSGRTARTTNLSWVIDADQMAARLAIAKISLINDFQAVGYGIEALTNDDLVELQSGREVPEGNRIVIGAGTGLGQGLLYWRDGNYEILPSEGGHADFAPTDDEQIGLLKHLRQKYGRCTWERVVSGTGISNIHDYMLSAYPTEETPALAAARRMGDSSAAISNAALAGSDPLALRTLSLFCTLYGAQAGNLALTGLATGGVYIAGGVAPRILRMLENGLFMDAFLNKDERMRDLLEAMPVRVVTNAKVGLLGAMVAAQRL